jgi:hypothetical protein
MYTGMSGVISFRTDDEVVDTVDRIVEQADEDVSRALVTKRLVEEAVEARETPLWVRVGLSDRRAAQIEALRQEGETEEDLARELLADALEARDEDVLDAIGASDELREAVEEHREEGESLDGAVERLLRAGVDASELDPLQVRLQTIVSALGYTFAVVGATVLQGWESVAVAAVLASLAVLAYTRFRPLGGLSAWG